MRYKIHFWWIHNSHKYKIVCLFQSSHYSSGRNLFKFHIIATIQMFIHTELRARHGIMVHISTCQCIPTYSKFLGVNIPQYITINVSTRRRMLTYSKLLGVIFFAQYKLCLYSRISEWTASYTLKKIRYLLLSETLLGFPSHFLGFRAIRKP